MKIRVQHKLISELDPYMDISKKDEVRDNIKELFDAILLEEVIILSQAESQRLFEQIVAEISGYSVLEPLLEDPSISEIMVNGPKNICVERSGKVERASVVFEDDDHVMRIVDRIMAPLGWRVGELLPIVNARLPDGSRINIVIHPISLIGPVLTIRKFPMTPLIIDDWIDFNSITPEAVEFLKTCIKARQRIIVCGNASSGKTTFLGLLARFIPDEERVVVIDDSTYELPLSNARLQRLPEHPTERSGEPGLTVYERVCIAASIRNARLILPLVERGWFWSPDVLDVVAQTSYLTEIYGRSSRSALLCLAGLCLHHGSQRPPKRAFQTFTNSIDLIVCLARLFDGTRKVISIDAVPQSNGPNLETQPLFTFNHQAYEGGRVIGQLQPVGSRPAEFLARLSVI
jgi:pilus assembly protein CpaF